MRRIENDTQWGKDKYLLLETSELAGLVQKHDRLLSDKVGGSWTGGGGYQAFKQRVTTGDESLVAESDKHLALIEDQVPMSRGWRNVDDVVGAVPNVPAFLAGHPQCMRRRQRAMRDTAPLAIFMDLTSSAGIDAKAIQKRGIVLLALTRLLVEHRPVELWVGTGLGGSGSFRRSDSDAVSATVAWRIDTAPLDLARAAFHISSVGMARGFGYKMAHAELNMPHGAWPFGNHGLHCRTAEQRLKQVFAGQELLYIPPIYLGDPMTNDPVAWVKRVLAQYVGEEAA
jgi:hypothetical protein